jgi:N-acetylglucosaminyldiphosphoundecaprenol N-acetyl-beta-D-mannosaminyltransferase
MSADSLQICGNFARKRILNAQVDDVDQNCAIEIIMGWCKHHQTNIVVNPNLDCLVKLHEIARLRDIYKGAGLVLADGWPLVLWSQLSGRPVPRVVGADLIIPLCRAAANNKYSIFLFGTTFDSLTGAAQYLTKLIPDLTIAGVYSPPLGFGSSATDYELALSAINSVEPDILFIALGAPKQEFFADEIKKKVKSSAIICVGASVDFLSGKQKRAPKIVRKLRLEWLWRIIMEPRRLGPRYLRQFVKLSELLWRYGR